MGSNNHSAQNSFVPMYNDDNNINYPNPNSNSVPEFEFFLPLGDKIFRVTYTQLRSFDIARRLNSGVDIIPDPHFPYHQNVQNFISQQVQQRVQQQHVYQPQQQPQIYNTIPTNSQVDMIPPNSQDNNPSDKVMSENTGHNYTTNYQTHNGF
ncbi:unnamed protein product [Rhizophagus irregularis]|uniref:Uncharacterized protein n=1 Tax=Rhizophagus irregularis TaxID=588596 RepID=A0A2I1H7U4_9GLOM|nr:hypothetical protein RhiirA4_502918 [Rhizophagus irregularis]CAB4433584.1 unnamed protein product [Rhizophagus irregularis]